MQAMGEVNSHELRCALLLTRAEEWWQAQERELPRVLYHYTSAEGLIGILESKSLWLTELRYMNDMSELQYAWERVREQIERARSTRGLFESQATFLERVGGKYDPFEATSVFAASFCEAGNLLSQWRAYRGRGGGYAIGFDLLHSLSFLSKPCTLRKVVYDANVQRTIVNGILTLYLDALAEEERKEGPVKVIERFMGKAGGPPSEFLASYSSAIAQTVYAFKHPDFVEEREWRLVHFASVHPRINRSAPIPNVRSYDGNIIPYFPVGLDGAAKASRDDTAGIPFLIREVMIGPTINESLNERSVRMLLDGWNPDAAPAIKHSSIPLRWL